MLWNLKNRTATGTQKPISHLLSNHVLNYATPSNLNYNWSFGSLAGIFFALQIVTGVILAMHYTPHVEWAFSSVEHIMTDVTGGYLFRYFHANGASFIFILIYAHMARNIYFQSFITRRTLWNSGVVIFLLMMATAFIGYVLPWGQMSFWGATVITSLVTAVPFIGEDIAYWVWGGFSINNATLTRFFSAHYLLPFLIVGIVGLHLTLLHTDGSSDPLSLGRTPTKITFHPYYTIKDAFILMGMFVLFATLVSYSPNLLGHSDNFIPANPLVTPAHIVPEWYFTPFYAILRACPNKLGGAISMFAAIILLFVLPYYVDSLGAAAAVVLAPHSDLHKGMFWVFTGIFLTLMFLGLRAAAEPYVIASKLFTCLYFLYFLLATPAVTRLNAAALLRRSNKRQTTVKRRKFKATTHRAASRKIGVRYFHVSLGEVAVPSFARLRNFLVENPRPVFYIFLLSLTPFVLPAFFLFQIAAKGVLQVILFLFSKVLTALSANILPALAAVFALRVPTAAHPVSALIALFGLFVTAVIILIVNRAEYLGLVFLIVYVGAIAILFLFVILLLNLSAANYSLVQIARKDYGKAVAIILTTIFCSVVAWKLSNIHFMQNAAKDGELAALEFLEATVTYQVGKETELFLLQPLYTSEATGFAIITLVLLFSLVGALVLTRLASDTNVKKTNVSNFMLFPGVFCVTPEHITKFFKLYAHHEDDIIFFIPLLVVTTALTIVQIHRSIDKIEAFDRTYQEWKPTIFEVVDSLFSIIIGIIAALLGTLWLFSDISEPPSTACSCTCSCSTGIIIENSLQIKTAAIKEELSPVFSLRGVALGDLREKFKLQPIPEYMAPGLPPHRMLRADYLTGRMLYVPWWKPWPDTIWLSAEWLAARPEGRMPESILERAIAGKDAPLYYDTPAVINVYTLAKEGSIKLAADCREIERQQWEFDKRPPVSRYITRMDYLQSKAVLRDARLNALARHEEISTISSKVVQQLLKQGEENIVKKIETDVPYIHNIADNAGNVNQTLRVLERERGDIKGTARVAMNAFVKNKGIAKLIGQPKFYDGSDDEEDMGVTNNKNSTLLLTLLIFTPDVFEIFLSL